MRIFLRWSSVHSSSTSKFQNNFHPTKEINTQIEILMNNIKTINDNIQHLTSELIKHKSSLQRLSQECSSLERTCQRQNIFISEFKSAQDMVEQKLLVIRQQMEDLHYVTHDGTCTWKIEDFAKKFGNNIRFS